MSRTTVRPQEDRPRWAELSDNEGAAAAAAGALLSLRRGSHWRSRCARDGRLEVGRGSLAPSRTRYCRVAPRRRPLRRRALNRERLCSAKRHAAASCPARRGPPSGRSSAHGGTMFPLGGRLCRPLPARRCRHRRHTGGRPRALPAWKRHRPGRARTTGGFAAHHCVSLRADARLKELAGARLPPPRAPQAPPAP